MLKIQKSYKNSAGQDVPLKTPSMKLIGKDMDEEEQHEFVVLKGPETLQPGTQFNKGKFAKHQMFVKYENDEQAFNLELSDQALFAMQQAQVKVGDRVVVSKTWYDNKKNGARMPAVEVSVAKQDKAPVQQAKPVEQPKEEPKQFDLAKEINEFLIAYKGQVAVENQNMAHLLSIWFKNKHKDEAEKIMPFFEAYLERHVTSKKELNL